MFAQAFLLCRVTQREYLRQRTRQLGLQPVQNRFFDLTIAAGFGQTLLTQQNV